MSFSKKDNYYILDGRELMPSAILAEVQRLDDEKRGKLLLDEKVAEKLDQLFSKYINAPHFDKLYFMHSSYELFCYLAESSDEVLLDMVSKNMGLKTYEQSKSELPFSSSYRGYWLKMSEEVLTSEGFDSYRFGSVKIDRNGCYLYDDEKAVMYIEISRDGDDSRNALLSFSLLGNPEAIVSEDQEREFEWCCYFDDMLSKEDPRFLGGKLSTVDPYGESSVTFRRYDVHFNSLDAITLGLIVKEAARLLAIYPPLE